MVTSIHYDFVDHISSPMWQPQVAREEKPYVARKTVPSGGTDGPKWPVGGMYAAHYGAHATRMWTMLCVMNRGVIRCVDVHMICPTGGNLCATSGSENRPTWCRHRRSQVATTTSANLRRLEEIEELKLDFEFRFEFQEKSALTNIGNKDHPKWRQIWSQVATNTVPSGSKD